MSLRLPIALLLGASIAAWGIDKDKLRFQPGSAASYADRQTISGVTIGVEAFDNAERAKKAFGNVHPYQYGVLPVLVVIQNDSKETIKLEGMQVLYVDRDGNRIEPTAARDLPYIRGPRRPNFAGQLPIPLPRKKNPLTDPVFEERAFAAKMVPPGDSVYGFFYYQSPHRRGSQLYIKGLREASTGQELFFYEIPMVAQ